MSQNDTVVNDKVVADTTATDSAPEEKESLEVVRDGEPLDPNDYQHEETEESSAAEESNDETSQADSEETQPQDEQTLSPKSENRFQQLANDNRALRQQIEELQAKKAQFATEQGLVNEINPETGEYYTPQEIERISWQQAREAQAERVNQELYVAQVQQNQATINDEAQRVTQDFPLLNPGSKEYVPEIGQQYAEALNDSLVYVLPNGQQANRSTLLANGINPDTQATLVGYSTSPHKLAKLAADAFNRAKTQGETIGQANAQKATEKMLANVDPVAGAPSAPSKKQVDAMSADEYAEAHGMKKVWQ